MSLFILSAHSGKYLNAIFLPSMQFTGMKVKKNSKSPSVQKFLFIDLVIEKNYQPIEVGVSNFQTLKL
jgi:hypothetical protein